VKKPPRKKASKPVIAQWSDGPLLKQRRTQERARREAIMEEARRTVDRITRLEREWKEEFERHRLAPLTDKQFWEACKKYFPAELQTPAAAYLLKMFKKAQRADAKKNTGKGRPPGVGSQVEELMTGPFKWDQRTARRLVAGGLCECRDKRGFPAEHCTCGSYESVADLHKQWRLDQQKAKAKQKR
jgi:hypothetical protein